MKAYILILACLITTITGYAKNVADLEKPNGFSITFPADSIKITVEGTQAYYQKVFKTDTGIKVSTIYRRTLQFMAAKNFQQNYGYEQEGKMILTSAQDLNANPNYANDNDNPDPYTVQFAITVDMRNGHYRCTINNINFYLPTDNGNRRMTLYELYLKETGNESRRTQKEARMLIESFERYLITLTNDLFTEVEHKAPIYNPKF